MPKVILTPQVLTGAVAIVGPVVPAGYNRKFLHAVAYNSTGFVQNVDLYLCPPTVVGGVTQQISHEVIESGEAYLCPELIGAEMGPGWTLQARCLDVSFSFVAEDTAITGA